MGNKLLLTLCVVILLAFTACDPNPGDGIVPVSSETLAAALDPAQAGASDYEFNYTVGDNVLSITESFVLPILVSYGTDKTASIAWTEQSDPDNNVALSGSGNRNVTVIRSATDKTVTLRAAIMAEGVTAVKDIDFTILAATTGIISGSTTWNSLDPPGDIQYLEGVVVTAAETTAMAPAAGSDATDVSGSYSMDLEPGNYYVSINFSGVSFPPSGDPDYRVSIGGVLVSEGGIYNRDGEDCRVDNDNNHLRSLSTYSVSTGVTTTVNFFVEGY